MKLRLSKEREDCRIMARTLMTEREQLLYSSGHSLTVCDGHQHTLIQIHQEPNRTPWGTCQDWDRHPRRTQNEGGA